MSSHSLASDCLLSRKVAVYNYVPILTVGGNITIQHMTLSPLCVDGKMFHV